MHCFFPLFLFLCDTRITTKIMKICVDHKEEILFSYIKTTSHLNILYFLQIHCPICIPYIDMNGYIRWEHVVPYRRQRGDLDNIWIPCGPPVQQYRPPQKSSSWISPLPLQDFVVDIINHWVMIIRSPSVTQILTTPGVTASDQYKLIRLNKAFYQIPKVLN